MAEAILRTEKLSKSFGVTRANKNIDFQLYPGEIRGLIGENGSGKSTLVSQLCGITRPTSGQMYKKDEPYAPASPVDATRMGVSMVVQELGVLSDLPGAINMFVGRTEQFSRGGLLNTDAMRRAAEEVMEQWGLGSVPLDIPAGNLSIEQRKLIELAKALSTQPEILVLDEISQALSHDKRQILYRVMREFTKQDRSIVMISHDLEETVALCDSITVLRDGEVVTTIRREDFDLNELKRLMIGREVDSQYYRFDPVETCLDEVALQAEDVTIPGQLEGVSFQLHRGEILGVCGLSDAGIHELGKALYGKAKLSRGSITVHTDGTKKVTRPGHITGNKGAYLSKDRDSDGLMLSAKISKNIQIPSVGNLASLLWWISPRKAQKLADDAAETFEIKCSGTDAAVNSLSGGNKQKVNLSRWMIKDLSFIILDCPTRGVDIGVKSYIYNLLYEAKKNGLGILLISDELPEVMGMSDRLLIMKQGKIARTLRRSEGFTEEAIVEVMI